MLLPVLSLILPVLIGLMGNISIEIPEISLPSKPKATPAEKAKSKIIDTIKNNKNSYYWKAYRVGGYIKIGGALSYAGALSRVSNGYDVFTYDSTFAYWLAHAASGGSIPVGPEIDKGKEFTVGYYWHYHTADRNGAHIFYLY